LLDVQLLFRNIPHCVDVIEVPYLSIGSILAFSGPNVLNKSIELFILPGFIRPFENAKSIDAFLLK